ncbi:hypothetical protein RhiirA5_414853 [Rhizophagus irregularis]|uniref:Uncharacterized protein n=1 Tax=Rhizophagus irregularis TaxID=588596 RepID=A0A2I1F589_9GLOM|nr:hypothetical protein RhiirA5_414853 [Rhizophagus irregularis]PKY29527.1 hypothetical protein RhiirB3_446182 [Rhizophagus irregularis]
MAGIATRYVTENELNNEMSIEELSKHAPALDILLTDKVKRDQARRRLKKGYNFSEEQVFTLIPKLTAGRKKGGALPNAPDTPDITQEVEPDTVNTCQISPKETIRDLAQPKALAESASNASAGLSRISRLRRELRTLKASEKIISATLIPDITRSANKIQKERSKQCEDEGIDFPDHFSLESVKERLDIYDVSRAPGLQALADVTIMLCIRPAEIKTLRISNGGVTGYAKNRGQQDIPRFNTFLKKDEFLPETGKPLLPSSLRKLEAVFAVVSHGAKNLSEAMTIASEGLRHSPDNYASPAKNYTIVNYRKRGQPYDQAKAIKIFDEN